MLIVVFTNDDLKAELMAQSLDEKNEVIWKTDIDTINSDLRFDVYIDLLFENNTDRVNKLQKLKTGLVLVNSVVQTLDKLPGFIRFNGWSSFLKRPIVEAAATNEKVQTKASAIFSLFNKKVEWVPDKPGFITAKVVAMIINEAYFALEEEVSTKDEIDIAMKLGTNYPYGPFEWAERIGLKNVYELLNHLSISNKRYKPSGLLQKEASK
jgi:3-hydroxybutyryl-CoA dehydrogenase